LPELPLPYARKRKVASSNGRWNPPTSPFKEEPFKGGNGANLMISDHRLVAELGDRLGSRETLLLKVP
jgi:hypothetical protein